MTCVLTCQMSGLMAHGTGIHRDKGWSLVYSTCNYNNPSANRSSLFKETICMFCPVRQSVIAFFLIRYEIATGTYYFILIVISFIFFVLYILIVISFIFFVLYILIVISFIFFVLYILIVISFIFFVSYILICCLPRNM